MALAIKLDSGYGVDAEYHNIKDFHVRGNAGMIEGFIYGWASAEKSKAPGTQPLMSIPFSFPLNYEYEVSPAVIEDGKVVTPAVTESIKISITDNLPAKLYELVKVALPTFKDAKDA